jgi:hypothetical protein
LRSLLFGITVLLFVQQDALKTISWAETRPLTWSDFEATPKPKSGSVALTASGITFGYSLKTMDAKIIDFETWVDAHFYPEKSWYLKDKADRAILKHEQLHFDITELHVRQFRKAISELKVSQKIKVQLETLQQAINAEANDMQKRYDKETEHSMNREIQKKWEDFVAMELSKYEAYKSK